MAERLGKQSDPSSEKLLSIDFSYIDNDFPDGEFCPVPRPIFQPADQGQYGQSEFHAYQENFDTRLYTFDGDEKPLYNEPPISYDTLNTTFTVQGKSTDIPDLRYVERSFDKFAYIYKKTVRNDTTGKVVGYLFILSEPKSQKSW